METRLECAVSDQLALRVDFIKLADRYGHELSAVIREGSSENVVPLCASVEGAGDDPWPPSPPLQSLSIEKLADGRTAALLVGMAGRSHWSASIEPRVKHIEFDYACRGSTTPERLACEYRAFPEVEIIATCERLFLCHSQHGLVGSIGGYNYHQLPAIIGPQPLHGRLEVPAQLMNCKTTCRWWYTFEATIGNG